MSTSSEKCTAIFYKRGSLGILDQLLLPEESRVIPIATTQDAWKAIQTMQVLCTIVSYYS